MAVNVNSLDGVDPAALPTRDSIPPACEPPCRRVREDAGIPTRIG
jgi:hypothetical protein